MNTSPTTALQALAFALAILLAPAMALGGILDDDLLYGSVSGSETEAYVAGLRNGTATHITIPETVVFEYTDGKDEDGNYIHKYRTCRVTSIGEKAFESRSGLTSVTIGDSVTSIGNRAFYNCSGLTSVTIGKSVTSIVGSAFSGCSSLTSVTIPNSVTSIGYSAFSGCSSLTSMTIPNSVADIGEYAFSRCNGLSNVTIGNSVTKIAYSAFNPTFHIRGKIPCVS